MTDMERALAQAIDDDIPPAQPWPVGHPAAKREAVILKAGKPATLTDMVTTLERVERELAGRIRREGVDAKCAQEERMTAAHAAYHKGVSEAVARLERERDEEIHSATEAYHAKLTELAGLLRRRP